MAPRWDRNSNANVSTFCLTRYGGPWTKTADLVDDGALGGTLARAPGATRAGTSGASVGPSAEEHAFRSTSPWRNLVRTWEMRNHKKLKTNNWREVANWIDQHPADMSILTQGAIMTPTVMLEGRDDVKPPFTSLGDCIKKNGMNMNIAAFGQESDRQGKRILQRALQCHHRSWMCSEAELGRYLEKHQTCASQESTSWKDDA
eukprot:142512-Amphidinium_carterae.1